MERRYEDALDLAARKLLRAIPLAAREPAIPYGSEGARFTPPPYDGNSWWTAGFWPALSEKLRPELSAKDRGFFAANGPLHPVLQGESTLIMAADNEFVLGMVKKPAIEQLIREKASALLGRPVAVRFALKNQVSNLGKDPMDALVQFGEQHSDIFTIK